jgi:hypothetical protein
MHLRVGVLFVCVLLLVSSVVYSEDLSGLRYAEPTKLAPNSLTFPQLLDQFRNGGGHSRARTTVASGDFEPLFIFPLVGSTAGGGGTFFHTASTIANHSNQPQTVELFWFPIGGGAANCNRSPIAFHMDARSWYYWPDFVSQVLGASGLGGVAVVAVDSFGNVDENAVIDGFSRIWTLIPGSSGSVSQSFVSESVNLDAGSQNAYGLEQDTGFRTNIGIFNYDVVPRTFNANISGQNGSTSASMVVDACTVSLGPGPAGNFGVMALNLSAADGHGLWYGFGSSVDNASGASWSSVVHP